MSGEKSVTCVLEQSTVVNGAPDSGPNVVIAVLAHFSDSSGMEARGLRFCTGHAVQSNTFNAIPLRGARSLTLHQDISSSTKGIPWRDASVSTRSLSVSEWGGVPA